eukprot:scaffold95175_cov16-Tisochrysis_lutea.AAC.1
MVVVVVIMHALQLAWTMRCQKSIRRQQQCYPCFWEPSRKNCVAAARSRVLEANHECLCLCSLDD